MMSYCMFCHTGTEDTSSYQLFWKQLKPPQTAWPLILEIALHFHWTPLDVFFFFFFSTELYVVSWPRYRKWKVPWMHRLDSLLRNDGMTEASDRFPLHCLQATQDKSACDSSVCVWDQIPPFTIDASTCRNIALYTYFTWTQWTTQCWEKNMTILCLMFFDLWPVTSSKVGSWYFLSKVQNEFWGLIYVYNTVMCSIF